MKVYLASVILIAALWKACHGVEAVDSWDNQSNNAISGYPTWKPQSGVVRRQFQDPARQAFLSLILQPAGLLMATVAGTVSNGFLTVSRTVENAEAQSKLSSRVDTISTKVATLETSQSTSSTSGSATCEKVNSILNVAELTATQTAIAAVTNFQLSKALASESAGTLTGTATVNSKALADADKVKIVGASPGNLALTADGENIGVNAKDFDLFRAAQDAVNKVLQAKIDEILALATLTC